jgi:hypothetical protein
VEGVNNTTYVVIIAVVVVVVVAVVSVAVVVSGVPSGKVSHWRGILG